MIVMKMCQERCIERTQRDAHLHESGRGASSHIKQELLPGNLDQCRGPKSIRTWNRVTCPQQRYSEILRTGGGGKKHAQADHQQGLSCSHT